MDPQPAVELYTSWSALLPRFVRENVLDQLVLPKLYRTIADWTPTSGGVSLHAIVFPWLEHVNGRTAEVLGEAKRKVKAWLRGWRPKDGVPKGLAVWREVSLYAFHYKVILFPLHSLAQAFSRTDWDSLILKHVLPQLGAMLREEFRVDPRKQDLAPLERALAWRRLLRNRMTAQLVEAEFMPKWIDALWVWLTHGGDWGQVSEWCVSRLTRYCGMVS